MDAFDYVAAGENDTGDEPEDDESDAGVYDDGDDGDAGWFGEDIVKGVKKGVRAVGKVAKGATKLVTKNPLWNIAKTGASFIPGVGTAVSAGMASAAAFGRGESLKNIGLAAARNAVPPGPARAAVDIAVGAIKGHGLSAKHLRAVRSSLPGGAAARGAFDAAVALHTKAGAQARAAIRSGLSATERKAFDRVVTATPKPLHAVRRAVAQPGGRTTLHRVSLTRRVPNPDRPFAHLTGGANRIATAIATRPEFRAMTAARLAQQNAASRDEAREAIAAFLRKFGSTRVFDYRDVGELESIDAARIRLGEPALPDDLFEWPTGDTGAIEAVALPPIAMTRSLLHSLYRRGDENVKKALLAHELLAHVARNTGELEGTSWRIQGNGDFPFKVAQTVVGDGNRWKEILAVNPELHLMSNGNIPQWTKGRVVQLPPSWFPSAIPATVPVSVSATGGPPFPPPSEFPHGFPSSLYVIRPGDTGEKVAARITGNKDRWRELLKTNPKLADPKFGIALFSGKTLALPASWQAPQASPAIAVQSLPEVVIKSPGFVPTVVAASPPRASTTTLGPPPAPPFSTGGAVAPSPVATVPPALPAAPPAASSLPPPIVTGSPEKIGAVQVMLAAFFRAHVDATFGVSGAPFGSSPEDLAGVWTDRTTAAMAGFQRWWNGKGRTPTLHTDGLPDGTSIGALLRVTGDDSGVSTTQSIELAVNGVPQVGVRLAETVSPAPSSPTSPPAPTQTARKSSGSSLGPLLLLAPLLFG